MTEVEFEKVCSIATSLEEIAEQMKIANKMKSKELENVMQILDSRESQPAIDPEKYVPRKESYGNTSTLVDSFTYDHGWK